MATLYHLIMIRWHGWRMHREIERMKRAGREHGLPSLDGYSDEAIAEGFRRLRGNRP